MSSRPTRRAVLAAGLTSLVAACTSSRPHRPAPGPPLDPDLAVTAAAVTRERALLAAYDEVLTATPALTAQLGPLRAEHLSHLSALGAPAAPVQPPVVPGHPAAAAPAQARLASLERRTASAHAAAAVTASRRLAPVLASLAASEASHLEVLG